MVFAYMYICIDTHTVVSPELHDARRYYFCCGGGGSDGDGRGGVLLVGTDIAVFFWLLFSSFNYD